MSELFNPKTPPILGFHGEYRWLSNFWNGPDNFTTEHYYQAAKAVSSADRTWVMAAKSPGEAKRRGGDLDHIREDWNTRRILTMKLLIALKLSWPTITERLLETGDAELVESNTWHDVFWGRCTCPKHGGRGENMLGRLWMEIRKEIRDASPSSG